MTIFYQEFSDSLKLCEIPRRKWKITEIQTTEIRFTAFENVNLYL